MKFLITLACITSLVVGVSIQDYEGKTIKVPDNPQRIVVSGGMWPFPPILMILDDDSKRIVLMPKATSNAIKNSLMSKFYPKSSKIANSNDQNIEEVLKFKPDVVFCHLANKKFCSAMSKTGIPTIGLPTNVDNYNYLHTLQNWLEIGGKILDKNELAGSLIKHNNEVENKIKLLLQDVKNKPKAMVLFRYGGQNEIVVVALFSNYLLETTGAINIFADIGGTKKVGLEEIYKLDPEIIYITNFSPAMPQDLYNNPSWKPVSAVKNKKVYKIPLGTYRWYAPSLEAPVFLQWLAKHNHPSIFKDIDIKAELKRHFKTFYHKDLSDSQIDEIFNPSPQAGNLQ